MRGSVSQTDLKFKNNHAIMGEWKLTFTEHYYALTLFTMPPLIYANNLSIFLLQMTEWKV